MSEQPTRTRRRFLALTGVTTLGGLAGCTGSGDGRDEDSGGGSGGGGAGSGGGGGDRAGQGLGPVPPEYETAISIDGLQRNPDSLQTKQALNYQSTPNGDQQCSNCRYYIEDKNGDDLGACTLVEGKIEPTGWCATFAPSRS